MGDTQNQITEKYPFKNNFLKDAASPHQMWPSCLSIHVI